MTRFEFYRWVGRGLYPQRELLTNPFVVAAAGIALGVVANGIIDAWLAKKRKEARQKK